MALLESQRNMTTHLRNSQTEPSRDFRAFHLRLPECNLVRELRTKPVREEEDAQARDLDFDRIFSELLTTLGLDPNGILPAWWQGWPAKTNVRRWIDDLGLSEDRIIETAMETRRDHPPPDGPMALDRAMKRAAKHDAQAETNSLKPLGGK